MALKLLAQTHPVYPDDQPEFTPACGFDPGKCVLHNYCLPWPGTKPPGCLQQHVRGRLTSELKFIRVDPIHLDIEELPYASRLQHSFGISTRRYDCRP